ncbi:MAG: glycerol-3-phosphate 1-O-acyltransferase PlsY [Alphaproteobacteria bacterium]|nr:glycerol-3-phosphate 1-O-acyltransferase PlsY [Alphaproteobacteria bacterium]
MLAVIQTSGLGLIAVASLGYLLGSVPFGILVARLMGLGNLRKIGSGNIGATNVLRTGNKFAAFLTLVFDVAKGGVAVALAGFWFGADAAQLAGLAAFLGHLFPVWLRFRGGKGVATAIGIILALNFWVGLAICATWLAGALLFRFSSLAALIAAASAPVWLILFASPSVSALALVLALLIFLRHKENIKRLLAGAEPKIGAKS